MLRVVVVARRIVALAAAGAAGVWGLSEYPFVRDNAFLGLIELRAPRVFALLRDGYATLWFSTSFLAASLMVSLVAIVVYRRVPTAQFTALPPYPEPETRSAPTLVLGEAHFEATPGRAPTPQWLTIPQRGLYTGIMVLGAVGTGKTSACMYPYVDQLLRWRSADPDRKIGGLVLEVKGDFCGQVRSCRSCVRSKTCWSTKTSPRSWRTPAGGTCSWSAAASSKRWQTGHSRRATSPWPSRTSPARAAIGTVLTRACKSLRQDHVPLGTSTVSLSRRATSQGSYVLPRSTGPQEPRAALSGSSPTHALAGHTVPARPSGQSPARHGRLTVTRYVPG